MGGCAFLFGGDLTISEQQKKERTLERVWGGCGGGGLVLDAKGQLSGADDSVCVCV